MGFDRERLIAEVFSGLLSDQYRLGDLDTSKDEAPAAANTPLTRILGQLSIDFQKLLLRSWVCLIAMRAVGGVANFATADTQTVPTTVFTVMAAAACPVEHHHCANGCNRNVKCCRC